MFWALVLSVTVNGHTNEYVIDQFFTAGSCTEALRTLNNSHYRKVSHVAYQCEKTTTLRG